MGLVDLFQHILLGKLVGNIPKHTRGSWIEPLRDAKRVDFVSKGNLVALLGVEVGFNKTLLFTTKLSHVGEGGDSGRVEGTGCVMAGGGYLRNKEHITTRCSASEKFIPRPRYTFRRTYEMNTHRYGIHH